MGSQAQARKELTPLNMKVLFLFALLPIVFCSPNQLYGAPLDYGYFSVAKPTPPPPVCTKVNQTVCETVMEEECKLENKEVCLTVQETICETVEEEQCASVQTQSCETEERQACTAIATKECTTVEENVCNTIPVTTCGDVTIPIIDVSFESTTESKCVTVNDIDCTPVDEEECTQLKLRNVKQCMRRNVAKCHLMIARQYKKRYVSPAMSNQNMDTQHQHQSAGKLKGRCVRE